MEIAQCQEGGCRPYTPVADWAEALREGGLPARARSSAPTVTSPAICAPPSRAPACSMRRSPPDAYPPRQHATAPAWSCGATRSSTTARNIALMPRRAVDLSRAASSSVRLRDKGARGAIRRDLCACRKTRRRRCTSSSYRAFGSVRLRLARAEAASGSSASSGDRRAARRPSMSISGKISSVKGSR